MIRLCGCDGMTYANACLAAMNGVNVAYAGSCAACVNRPVADLNNDCKVNILDLAMMAVNGWIAGTFNIVLRLIWIHGSEINSRTTSTGSGQRRFFRR